MIMRPVLILFCLIFIIGSGFAQTVQVKFKLIGGASGIGLGRITDILHDRDGYMWFTDESNHCITRYDGTQMIRYQYNPRDTTGLGGPHPECMLQDSTGIIWIGFYGQGVDRFDPAANTFTHFRYKPNDKGSLLNDSVTAIVRDHLGNLWVGSNQGLDRLDPSTGKFIHYQHNPQDPTSLSYHLVRSLYEDREGTLWVGTGTPWESPGRGGLNRFNRETGSFTRYLADAKNPQALVNNKVRSIFEDSRGTLWVGTAKNGLHSLDRKTGLFHRYSFNPAKPENLAAPQVKAGDDHITFIVEDAAKNLWIGSWANGMNRYDPVTQRVTHFGGSASASEIFHDKICFRAIATTDGLLWVSTQENNTFMADIFVSQFPRLEKEQVVTGFFEESPDVLWMATQAGLVRKDFKQDKTTRKLNDPTNPNSLTSNKLTQLLTDAEGNFWVGTEQGLNRYNPTTGKITRFQHDDHDPESLPGQFVHKLALDEEGLWVFTHGGVALLDMKTLKFARLQHNPSDSTSITNDIVTGFLRDKSQKIWMINYFEGGVQRRDGQAMKFRHYLRGQTMVSILQDAQGVIWVASTNGLFHYDPAADKFIRFGSERVDFELDNLANMIEDNQENLWVATDQGLAKINKARDHIVMFNLDNGILPISFFYFSALKRQDGQLLFGGNRGFYAFYPDRITVSTDKPKVDLTNFWLKGKLEIPSSDGVLKRKLSKTNEIVLGYDENVFSFTISAIDFRHPETRHAYYQLENYDKTWNVYGLEEKAFYYNVPPGKYNFRVKAMNSANGLWDEKSVSIVISPPWWKSWWAYTLWGFSFLGLVYSGHRYQRGRVIRAERERNRDRELVQAREIEKAYRELRVTQDQLIQSEKMASLGELTAGIAHEIQNPLNFVNNFSEVNSELIAEMKSEMEKGNLEDAKAIANNIDENERKIIFHGKRADAIVKGMLQHSRSSSGMKEPTDLNALADEYLRLAFHGLRARDKSFNAKLETNFDNTIGSIHIIPQDIGRVILNLITNAFYAVGEKAKGGNEGYVPTVWVSSKKTGDKVEVSVQDNGIGIPQKVIDKIFHPFFTTKPTGQGTGLGLSLSYDIVKAHGGELKVETTEGKGSIFIIQLPCL